MSAKVFIAFVVVSISSMFTNNAFMNAHEYFYYKLRNVTDDHDPENSTNRWLLKQQVEENGPTQLQTDFEAYLTVYGGIACVLGSLLNVFATKSLSNSCRMIWGHILVAIVFIPTIILTFVDFDSDQELFFNVSMLLFSVACFGSLGMIAGGVLGLSALFPPKYTKAVMVGQSLSGVLAAVMSILCQAVTSNVILNGQMYFAFSLFMTLLSVITYFYLSRIDPQTLFNVDESRNRLLEEEIEDDDDLAIETQAQHFPPIDEDEIVESNITPWEQYAAVIKRSYIDLMTVSVVLLVTLAAYPGLTSLVRSTSRNHTWNAYFSAVASFLLYNTGDLIGRSVADSLQLPNKVLLVVSVLRFALIPLIMMCNVAPRSHSSVILPYDGVFILLNLILATSHGYCITNATIGATKSDDKASCELAGSITSLIGVTAAMIGGVLGVLVIKLV